jgi:glycosyltransferase involved in cell wall biosynthesis
MKRDVFIISSMQLVNGKTAGSQRVLNFAKSLALGQINVYLCSFKDMTSGPLVCKQIFPDVYHLYTEKNSDSELIHIFNFVSSLQRYIEERRSDSIIYIYPTPAVFNDLIFLIYFKFLKKNRVFCEINELRVTNIFSITSPRKIVPKIVFYFKFPFKYLKYKLNEIATFFYDGIIVISFSLEKYFSAYSKNIIRVPILSDLNQYTFRSDSHSRNKDAFKICFSGTISNKKEGLDLLFKAISEVNHSQNVELHFYGIIPDNEDYILGKLSQQYKIEDKVFYHGFIEPSELHIEYNKYDLLILPRPLNKQAKYGFSTKLSEYLVSGIPTLLTDVSDNGFYIKDGFNGYLIRPGSLTEMVSKINNIIENYNVKANEIAINAYKTAQDNFDYRLYTDILKNFLFTLPTGNSIEFPDQSQIKLE